jgi:hypothetical protein
MGKTLTQVADYVAMRTLAGARPPKHGVETDTILSLFDPGVTPPPSMTLVDQSFLKGLYEVRSNGRAIFQMSGISKQIVKDSKERSGTDN